MKREETEKFIFKGYDSFGLPIYEPVETPRPRNLAFVITWEHAGRVGMFSCYGFDEKDARLTFRDAPGYFGYRIIKVENLGSWLG